jgi:hypothetical protein
MDPHSRVEAELRRRIRTGTYPPGARLPTRRALEREFGTSSRALQSVFHTLARQGFIQALGARGTFVAADIPNRSTIALVFPERPEAGSWNRFWTALAQAATDGAGKRSRTDRARQWGRAIFRTYHLRSGRPTELGDDDLRRDVEDGALAGIVFASDPFYVPDSSPLLTAPTPRVCISSRPLAGSTLRASMVGSTDRPAIARILQRFHAAGRRRLAGVTSLDARPAPLLSLARSLGFDTRPEWWQAVPTDRQGSACARSVVHLLGTLPPRQRPDALLITDDNLVPQATQGVLDAGLLAGRDLDIAAHANLPVVTHAAVPCLRYGLDADAVLHACAVEVQRLATGGAPRQVVVASLVREVG